MNESQGASTEMPRYQRHKQVWALQVKAIQLHNAKGNEPHQIDFIDARYAPIFITDEMYQKHKPMSGWYYVVYPDGYESFSPAESFESGYTRI